MSHLMSEFQYCSHDRHAIGVTMNLFMYNRLIVILIIVSNRIVMRCQVANTFNDTTETIVCHNITLQIRY